jgi:hypothetical protein
MWIGWRSWWGKEVDGILPAFAANGLNGKALGDLDYQGLNSNSPILISLRGKNCMGT